MSKEHWLFEGLDDIPQPDVEIVSFSNGWVSMHNPEKMDEEFILTDQTTEIAQ